MPGQSSSTNNDDFENTEMPFDEQTFEEGIQEEDPSQSASDLAFLKYGKPRKAPLIKSHTVRKP